MKLSYSNLLQYNFSINRSEIARLILLLIKNVASDKTLYALKHRWLKMGVYLAKFDTIPKRID